MCCAMMSDLGAVPLRGALGALRGVKTISVVLPCANESFVQRTVESIWANTPKEELLEIIIVDDASWPPVTCHDLARCPCSTEFWSMPGTGR